MAKKFTICIDMDDTITTLVTAWIRWLNKTHGYNIDPDDVKQWDIPPLFPTLTPYEVFEPMWIPEFWDTVQPKNDSVYWVKQLIDDGHNVYICNKQMIRCDYLVDDGAHNIVGPYKGLLMDMPHNRSFQHEGITRVHNFKEVYKIITADANAE